MLFDDHLALQMRIIRQIADTTATLSMSPVVRQLMIMKRQKKACKLS